MFYFHKTYGADPDIRDFSGKKAHFYLSPDDNDEDFEFFDDQDLDEMDSRRHLGFHRRPYGSKQASNHPNLHLRDFLRASKRHMVPKN